MSRPAAALSGAERRTAEKELAALDRRIQKLGAAIAAVHERMATADQSDFAGLSALMSETAALEAELTDAETRWLEVSEALE